MSFKPNLQQRATEDGFWTTQTFIMIQDLYDRLEAAENKLVAISEVTAPAGGATIDAEARTAINDILAI